MKYCCGTLKKYPRQSATFRFLTTTHLRDPRWWPEKIRLEAAILCSTPDISRRWLQKNLGIAWKGRQYLRSCYPPEIIKPKVDVNLLSINYDDCVNYMQRGPKGCYMPRWCVPAYLDDVKNGVPYNTMQERWGDHRWARKRSMF